MVWHQFAEHHDYSDTVKFAGTRGRMNARNGCDGRHWGRSVGERFWLGCLGCWVRSGLKPEHPAARGLGMMWGRTPWVPDVRRRFADWRFSWECESCWRAFTRWANLCLLSGL